MQDIHTGKCLCGAVRFETRGALREVIACHCSQCRRQTGLYYAATNVADDRLTVEGAENVTWYRASDDAARGFCRTCGSALFWKADGRTDTSIMAGSFDQPTDLKIGVHIFCADKGDFYEINDGAPQFAASSN
ncbi:MULTISPECIES: GFA family protein [unclassified Rhizobium]|uniref:GFA family protein n=1 Tax=unclassified Rhizobium TaxID=2613769 RepID=UPI0006FE00A2|nr:MULTISPECIES: GFA family protein [unclassified Rhizobium]KQV34754.1 aldehyde-activating protein [Rhizobium sp. Root1212]KRD24088.1 aldehyde-activating protein [Rhizobium sp. Root268]